MKKPVMMDRGTVRNMESFIPKNKFEKLMHLVSFIIRIYHDEQSPERQTENNLALFCHVVTVENRVRRAIARKTKGKSFTVN